MIRITMSLLLLGSLLLSGVHADPIVVDSGPNRLPVIELYTSEGCSSCPPADRWLGELIDMPDPELKALALAFHVDYWDYIGWKDEFADPRFTLRQKALGERNRMHTIYTPGFFVNGEEARGTYRIMEKIRQSNRADATLRMRLTVIPSATDFQVNLETREGHVDGLHVQFVVFEDGLGNRIERGENAGRNLLHHHVVRYLSEPRNLQPAQTVRLDIPGHWNPRRCGLGAIVTDKDGKYLQSVYALIE